MRCKQLLPGAKEHKKKKTQNFLIYFLLQNTLSKILFNQSILYTLMNNFQIMIHKKIKKSLALICAKMSVMNTDKVMKNHYNHSPQGGQKWHLHNIKEYIKLSIKAKIACHVTVSLKKN